MAYLTLIAAREYVVPGTKLADLPTVGPWLLSIPAVRGWRDGLSGLRVLFVAGDDQEIDPKLGADTLSLPVPAAVLARFHRERDARRCN